jgi:hypothetical protein
MLSISNEKWHFKSMLAGAFMGILCYHIFLWPSTVEFFTASTINYGPDVLTHVFTTTIAIDNQTNQTVTTTTTATKYLTKQDLYTAGRAVAPRADVDKYLECSASGPSYSSVGCTGPLALWRVQLFITELTGQSIGGCLMCPELNEWYSNIARTMKPNSIYCDVGFANGASAAIFLHHGKDIQVHAFDNAFITLPITLLQELYGKNRLHTHDGELGETVKQFVQSGKKCDVIFLDSGHPQDMIEFRQASHPDTIVLYHWHFRTVPEAKKFFVGELKSGRFIERICLKIWCTLTPDRCSERTVRENCAGRYVF